MNELSNIKIIFIDIDGTLVDSNKNISSNTINSIKRVTDKGIKVVLTSGRDYIHTIRRSRACFASSIVICSTGAYIYDFSKDSVIFSDRIDSSLVYKIYKFCNSNFIGALFISSSGKYYNSYFPDDEMEDGFVIDSSFDFDSRVFSQIVFVTDSYEKIFSVTSYCLSLGLYLSNSSSSFLNKSVTDRYSADVNNVGVSKGSAIRYLLNYLNISPCDALCFGDHYNDIEMFKACGISVSMGNGCDELKSIATFVTKSNDEDGVSWFLDKYL